MKDKKIITILTIFTIIFTFFGSTLAYWNWSTNTAQATNVTFTVTRDFSCAADGGGNISSTDNKIAPADCLNTNYAIQRTVTVTPTINRSGVTVYMDLWLDIESIGSGLTNSNYFMYALTESPTSCVSNPKASGTFKGKVAEDQIKLLDQEPYTTSGPKTYYLYIWLHKDETSTSTMDQPFNLTLGGQCSDTLTSSSSGYTESILNGTDPVLEPGMIPVTISDTGAVTSADTSEEWYSYQNKQWANSVLVNSTVRSTYINQDGTINGNLPINETDILAYYVWIPRYSYKMPSIQCSIIEGVNATEHPGCYKIVLNNPNDKLSLIQAVYDFFVLEEGYTSYTIGEATSEVEEGLETGIFISTKLGYANLPMVHIIELGSAVSAIEYTPELQPNRKILTGTPGTIDIKFTSSIIEKEIGDAINTYRTHPAFTFGTSELNGIWVGKFETGHSTLSSSTTNNNLSCTTIDCENANELIIKPNVTSLKYNNVSNFFYASRSMTRANNPFGLTTSTDTHMMKNSEWGAVAYLSHSVYGINQEIEINSNSSYTTGAGDGTIYGTPVTGTNIYPQSTTGDITGVFDISGGADEYVMGIYNDTIGSSGFSSLPDSKYYDEYTASSFDSCTLSECGGHALHETRGWYCSVGGEYFIDSSYPWMARGREGVFGVVNSNGDYGGAAISFGFRSVAIRGA